MKKTLLLAMIGFSGITLLADAELDMLKKRVADLEKTLTEVKTHDNGDNIKFDADFRTSYDVIDYKTASEKRPSNNLLSNRLILNMSAKPREDLSFKGALSVNKVFGNNTPLSMNGFNNYDWFGTVTPDDGLVRLREAYFLYYGNIGDVPYSASLGRRPSLNGAGANFRDDDYAASPLSHIINMEFDGASFKFDLDKVLGISGNYFKICTGRGYTNSNGKYNMFGSQAGMPPYSTNVDDTPNMDLLGFIFQPYYNGQYQVLTTAFRAFDVLGLKNPMDPSAGFTSVGNVDGMAATFIVDGIGDMINDYLDNTKLFVSYAKSITDPSSGKNMLGSMDKEEGDSFYVGVQAPCLLTDNARIGLEYNKGSKYWRSFTYGEDTLIGSKLATRGSAVEAYWQKDLLGKNLTIDLRYTKIKYDYTGSDMFFGASGTPMAPEDMMMAGMGDPVKESTNFRTTVRYRY